MLIENAILVDSAFHSAAFFVVGNSCIIQGVFAFQKAVKKNDCYKILNASYSRSMWTLAVLFFCL